MTQQERDYTRVYHACYKAYAGGCSYGIDWRTISEAWRDAFRRVGYKG